MQTSDTKATEGAARWSPREPRPGVDAFHRSLQKVQMALLEGAGAEWVRIRTKPESTASLLIEMLGGDEERARGLIDPIVPDGVTYEFLKPPRHVMVAVKAVRKAALLNRKAQRSYVQLVLRATRAIGGAFNPRV